MGCMQRVVSTKRAPELSQRTGDGPAPSDASSLLRPPSRSGEMLLLLNLLVHLLASVSASCSLVKPLGRASGAAAIVRGHHYSTTKGSGCESSVQSCSKANMDPLCASGAEDGTVRLWL